MKISLSLFVLAFATIFATMTATFLIAGGYSAAATGGQNELDRSMRRDAELLEYFCLSRIPPLGGSVTIPKEWETALGADITLSDHVGEIVAGSKSLAGLAPEIRKLAPGESVFAVEESPPKSAYLVYKPKLAGTLLLKLTRPEAGNLTESTESRASNWPISAAAAAASALLITLLHPLLLRQRG